MSSTARRFAGLGVAAVVIAAAGVAFAVGRSDVAEPVATRAAGSATTSEPVPTSPVAGGTVAPTTRPSTTRSAPVTAPPRPSYAFPVQPAGVADYPRSHHDYPAADIFAPCGATVVAPTSGTVQEVTVVDVWSSSNDDPATRGGLSFAIVGDDGVRYYGSHLARLEAPVVPGARVETGSAIGQVGRTGNARGTACHLHFGISTPCGPGDVLRRRGEFWPQEHLDDWAAGGQSSPSDLADPTTC